LHLDLFEQPGIRVFQQPFTLDPLPNSLGIYDGKVFVDRNKTPPATAQSREDGKHPALDKQHYAII
jgi:hypothetical protein